MPVRNLNSEEPDAFNVPVRICEGQGEQSLCLLDMGHHGKREHSDILFYEIADRVYSASDSEALLCLLRI